MAEGSAKSSLLVELSFLNCAVLLDTKSVGVSRGDATGCNAAWYYFKINLLLY